MSVLDRIERLRNVMEQQKIDCYIIPTDDYHHSEYVGDYFKFREYITGFTGSAGTAVFTKDKAGLVDRWQILYSGRSPVEGEWDQTL